MTNREKQIFEWIVGDPTISQEELAQKAGITRSSVAVHISNLMKKGYIVGKGYITQTEPYAVVIGGINIDIGGRPMKKLVAHDSNPGRVNLSVGGVGRNIAHNMRLLGIPVKLITAVGDDANAAHISESCADIGIDLTHSLKVPQGATSTYIFISDENGDMELAVSDMEIYSRLTPAFLASKLPVINKAKLVVVDTNIPEESIAWLAENCKAPLFADPVSTTKAQKLVGSLSALHTIKPNRIEAEVLTGVRITDERSARQAASTLLDRGIRRVYITLGGDGVLCADGKEQLLIPCGPVNIVNATGAGDAFMAALAFAHLNGLPLNDSCQLGLNAAALTMQSAETVNPDMSVEAITNTL